METIDLPVIAADAPVDLGIKRIRSAHVGSLLVRSGHQYGLVHLAGLMAAKSVSKVPLTEVRVLGHSVAFAGSPRKFLDRLTCTLPTR